MQKYPKCISIALTLVIGVRAVINMDRHLYIWPPLVLDSVNDLRSVVHIIRPYTDLGECISMDHTKTIMRIAQPYTRKNIGDDAWSSKYTSTDEGKICRASIRQKSWSQKYLHADIHMTRIEKRKDIFCLHLTVSIKGHKPVIREWMRASEGKEGLIGCTTSSASQMSDG